MKHFSPTLQFSYLSLIISHLALASLYTYTEMCKRATFKGHCTFTGAIINHLKAVKKLTGHVQQDKPYAILSPNDSTTTAREKYQVQK